MTALEITARVIKRLDDDPTAPASTTPAEVLAAINEGQELASMLTLCLETTAALTLPAATTFLSLRSTFPKFLVPLRLTVAGARVKPATLKQLDAASDTWQATPGTPARYLALGFNFFGVTPQPSTDAAAQFTFAATPDPLVGDDFPQLPEAYHQSLVDYGIYRVKLKEGGQGLQRGLVHLNRFLDDMTRLGDYVRAKGRAANYDVLPLELALFDRSGLTDLLMKGTK